MLYRDSGSRFTPFGLIFIAVLVGLATFYGLGTSYPRFTTPRSSAGLYRMIHGDGWIQDGATIRLPHLASRGNYLDLTLDAWRPAGNQPAEIEVSLCGKVASLFVVTPEATKQRLFLPGDCEPRELRFSVKNPFVPSDTDTRQLGAKLLKAELSSALGVPLISPLLLLKVGVALFVLTFLASLVVGAFAGGTWAWAPAALVPLAAFLILRTIDNLDLVKVTGLWLLFTFLSLGALVASRLPIRQLSANLWTGMEPRRVSLGWGFLIGLVVLGGAALRFYGLSFGLPNNYHPDEVPKVNAIMRMVEQGNLDPNYFLHPSLLLYLTYLTNSIFHWVGLNFDWIGIPGDFRSTAFLAGRTVSAIAGSLTILWVYLIGRRLFTRGVGLAGALLLATFPLHVTCSRYMKEDVLLTCMILACVVALLKAVQEDKKGFLYFAGFLAGVSASSKYSGLLSCLIVASAPWLRSRSFRPDFTYFVPTFIALVLSPLGFVCCTPYSILNSQTFLKDFGSEGNHMLRGHTIPVDAWSQYWMYHFWRSVIPGMSSIVTLISIAGVGLLLWRRRIDDLFIVGLVLMFYLPAEWVKAKPEPQPERYIFPCLPFLALAAAEMLRVLKLTRARVVVPVLFVLMLVAPLKRSLELASEVPDDTRNQMSRWMIENLPKGSKVYLDWKPYAPRFWHDEFHIVNIPRARILEKLDVQNLRNSGFDYLVLSGLFYERYFTQPLATPVLGERIRQVFERVPVVKEFAAKHGTYGFHNPRLTLFSMKPEDFERLDKEREAMREGKVDHTTNQEKSGFPWWSF